MKLMPPNLTLVYQMGKVGSSSIQDSIEDSIHLHSLFGNPPNPPHYAAKQIMNGRLNEWMRNKLKLAYIKSAKKIKIVSIVREPIPRNISMFFQALPFWLGNYETKLTAKPSYFQDLKKAITKAPVNRPTVWKEQDMQFLIDCFLESFNHQYPCEWMDREVKRLTNIDVYDYAFDRGKGFTVYESEKYSIMIIKMRDISKNTDAISDFVGERISIGKQNESVSKWYAPVYEEFNRRLVIPKELEEKLNGSKYAQHFFTDDELRRSAFVNILAR